MQCTRYAYLVLVLSTCALLRCSAGAVGLDEYRAIYDREAAKIEAGADVAAEANSAYLRALDALADQSKKVGDFEGTVAAQEEKQRFETAKSVPDEPEAGLPGALQRLQGQYREQVARAELARARQIGELSQKYLHRLKALMRALLADEKMVDAERVNQEVKRIEFVLADISAKLEAAQPDTEPSEETEAKPTPTTSAPGLSTALKRGLILHYDFNNDPVRSVRDMSAKRNSGKASGGTWVENARGRGNGGYEFDGRTWIDSMVTDESAGAFEELTYAVWVKPADRAAEQHIFARNDGRIWYQNIGGFGIDISRSQYLQPLVHFNEGGDRRLPFGKTVRKGTWCHLAVVHTKDGRVQAFIDGDKVMEKSGFAPIAAVGGGRFRLGRWSDEIPMAYFFRGILDDVMVWQRALSEEEVDQLHRATR